MENKRVVSAFDGPRPGSAAAVAPISKARAAVLAQLRQAGDALSVEQLARLLGLHANTAREHLDALVNDGHAVREAAPKLGRGRPAWLYQAAAAPAGPVGYAALAAALAQHLAANSSNPAAEGEAAGRSWAQAMPATGRARASGAATRPAAGGTDRQAANAPGKAAGKAARSHVATALAQAGFAVQSTRDATELTLTVCPIVEAARENPEVVCAVHLGLAKELLAGSGLPERGVKLLPFAGPGFCTLLLPATQQPPAAGGTP